MTSSNLELVKSIASAWERGDFSSAEWAHPDIDFVIAEGPSPGSWTGPAGMAEGFRGWLSAWDEWRNEVNGYLEIDGERVLVLLDATARGKTSGVDIARMGGSKGAALLHLHDGKVTRLVVYWNRDRAFADLGLPPDASPHS